MLENFTINYEGGKVRQITKEGRTYLVAPATILIEGVLNGSKGALFYPRNEIKATASDWRGIPIVVYHPNDPLTNTPLSAYHPGVYEKSGIGWVDSPRYSVQDDNAKLKTELWIDLERAKRIDLRVVNALTNGEPIELSTGLYTRNEPMPPGTNHHGIQYDYIAKDYKPDHLAILPDQTGACSLNDGCGVLINHLLGNSNPEGINQYSHMASQASDLSDKAKTATRNAPSNPATGPISPQSKHDLAAGLHREAASAHREAASLSQGRDKDYHERQAKAHERWAASHDSGKQPVTNKMGNSMKCNCGSTMGRNAGGNCIACNAPALMENEAALTSTLEDGTEFDTQNTRQSFWRWLGETIGVLNASSIHRAHKTGRYTPKIGTPSKGNIPLEAVKGFSGTTITEVAPVSSDKMIQADDPDDHDPGSLFPEGFYGPGGARPMDSDDTSPDDSADGINNKLKSLTSNEAAELIIYNDRWPQSKRDKLPDSDFAGPNQSFPIKSQKDVESATRLAGHAEDPDTVREKIKKISERKGLSLPDSIKNARHPHSLFNNDYHEDTDRVNPMMISNSKKEKTRTRNNKMSKVSVINRLILKKLASESDRKILMGLSLPVLNAMPEALAKAKGMKMKQGEEDEDEDDEEDEDNEDDEEEVENDDDATDIHSFDVKGPVKSGSIQAGGAGTPDEYSTVSAKSLDAVKNKKTAKWLAEAPPEIRSVVKNAMKQELNVKKQFASRLVGNLQGERRKQTFAFMMRKPIDELKMLIDLMPATIQKPIFNHASEEDSPTSIPLFVGAGLFPLGTPTGNAGTGNLKNDGLELPTINFEEIAAEGIQKALKDGLLQGSRVG